MIVLYVYIKHTYRIIAAGKNMKKITHNVRPLISKWTLAATRQAGGELSDHYPVSIDLQCPEESESESERKSESESESEGSEDSDIDTKMKNKNKV